MSTTSQKHRNFVAEPMNDKSVTDLAGIGEVLGKRLESKGFDKVSHLQAPKEELSPYMLTEAPFSFQAYVVLGQYLILKKNKDLFIDWLKDIAGANTKQASDCYQCLSDWCDEFL